MSGESSETLKGSGRLCYLIALIELKNEGLTHRLVFLCPTDSETHGLFLATLEQMP